MKQRNRIRRILALTVTASMLAGTFTVPVMAGNEDADTRDVTFTVSAGDLLIATNPVAWGVDEKGDWVKQEEPLGSVTLPEDTEEDDNEATSSFFAVHESGEADGHGRCATIEKNEKFKAWVKAHPEALKSHICNEPADYKVGDVIWHGYNREHLSGADYLMGDAPVYKGDTVFNRADKFIDGQEEENGSGSDIDQVYRQYRCMATTDKLTIWSYVAGSETEVEPDADMKYNDLENGEEVDTPTYLSTSRAQKILKDLDGMDFMKNMEDSAGDYKKTDENGDKDGKVAFFFEPMDPSTLGFYWMTDQYENVQDFTTLTAMDCLHIQAQVTLGDKVEGNRYRYDDDTGTPPFATMAHELTHYVVGGYCPEDDGWINEWFAQAVMVDVIPWDGSADADSTVSNDVKGVVNDFWQHGRMRVYAGPTDPADSLTYPVTTLMAGFFTGRMDRSIWKDAIADGCVTEKSFSEFLKKRDGGLNKGLNWWRSMFSLSVLGHATGEYVYGVSDNELVLNPFDDASEGIAKTHAAITDRVVGDLQMVVSNQQQDGYEFYEDSENDIYEKRILGSLNDLTVGEGKDARVIEGGGTAYVFEVSDNNLPDGEDTMTLTIEGVGKDVAWAHKDGDGFTEVDIVPEPEEKEEEEENDNNDDNKDKESADEVPVRDANGNWTYTEKQKKALEQSLRDFGEMDIEGTDLKLGMDLYVKAAAFYKSDKKALLQQLIDKDKCKVSINGVDLKIKKVTLKNVKNAYVSPNSIFRDTISENNLSAYSSYSEKKLPGIVITIDTKGADKETKKAAKKANKMFKKNPVGFDLLPVNLTGSNVSVDKYNDSKQAVKKMSVTDQDGNTNKLKKKDFSSEASGDQNVITGEINFNGSVIYDPNNNTVKAN